jgi:hypothetical protein
MLNLYYNRQGEPISQEEGTRLFGDIEGRRVALTETSDADISTVHLVINHQWRDGPPLIFETMIFGGKHDQCAWRYATEEQALEGHTKIVAALQEDKLDELWCDGCE